MAVCDGNNEKERKRIAGGSPRADGRNRLSSATVLETIPHVDSYFDLAENAIRLVPVFAAQLDSSPVQLSPEHERYEWLQAEDARRRLVWPGQRRSLEIVQ